MISQDFRSLLSKDLVSDIMGILNKGEGGSAYLVGGCLRNFLLNVPVKDIDIATSYLPDEVTNLLQSKGIKTIPTGIDHGTVTALGSRGHTVEITTLRRDVETDGRRAVVAFTKDIAEDARRRDFTLNALYLDNNGKFLLNVEIIEKLGADSLIYGTDQNQNSLCLRVNGNTKINVNEKINLAVQEDKYHYFDATSKIRLI